MCYVKVANYFNEKKFEILKRLNSAHNVINFKKKTHFLYLCVRSYMMIKSHHILYLYTHEVLFNFILQTIHTDIQADILNILNIY